MIQARPPACFPSASPCFSSPPAHLGPLTDGWGKDLQADSYVLPSPVKQQFRFIPYLPPLFTVSRVSVTKELQLIQDYKTTFSLQIKKRRPILYPSSILFALQHTHTSVRGILICGVLYSGSRLAARCCTVLIKVKCATLFLVLAMLFWRNGLGLKCLSQVLPHLRR